MEHGDRYNPNCCPKQLENLMSISLFSLVNQKFAIGTKLISHVNGKYAATGRAVGLERDGK